MENFNRLLDKKIETFNVYLAINGLQRMIFLLPGTDGFEDRDQHKKILLGLKVIYLMLENFIADL